MAPVYLKPFLNYFWGSHKRATIKLLLRRMHFIVRISLISRDNFSVMTPEDRKKLFIRKKNVIHQYLIILFEIPEISILLPFRIKCFVCDFQLLPLTARCQFFLSGWRGCDEHYFYLETFRLLFIAYALGKILIQNKLTKNSIFISVIDTFVWLMCFFLLVFQSVPYV